MPSPKLGAARKHTNHLRLVEKMMHDDLPQKVVEASTLEHVYNLLVAYPSIGRFLAFQFTIDINYTNLVNFSETDFVVAGPGAKDGIRKCFSDIGNYSEEDVIRAVTDEANRQFDRLEIPFSGLWGRPLQLIDCQNLFCEVDKYSRVAHPDVCGFSGRTRIKQKYVPVMRLLPQWYPPRWNLFAPSNTSQPNEEAAIVTPLQEALIA